MASREAIYQEFYNNEELQGVLLYNAQSTGTVIASGCSTFGKVEKVLASKQYTRDVLFYGTRAFGGWGGSTSHLKLNFKKREGLAGRRYLSCSSVHDFF